MNLEGYILEDFDNWYNKQDISFQINIVDFMQEPLLINYGVFLSFYASKGIYINLFYNEDYNGWSFDVFKNNKKHEEDCWHIKLEEAIESSINKCIEIYDYV